MSGRYRENCIAAAEKTIRMAEERKVKGSWVQEVWPMAGLSGRHTWMCEEGGYIPADQVLQVDELHAQRD